MVLLLYGCLAFADVKKRSPSGVDLSFLNWGSEFRIIYNLKRSFLTFKDKLLNLRFIGLIDDFNFKAYSTLAIFSKLR